MFSVLFGLVTLSALSAVVLCWLTVGNTRELRGLQAQAAGLQNSRALVGNLIAETVEYSKTHPAIDPILEGIGAKPAPAVRSMSPAPSTAKPSTR